MLARTNEEKSKTDKYKKELGQLRESTANEIDKLLEQIYKLEKENKSCDLIWIDIRQLENKIDDIDKLLGNSTKDNIHYKNGLNEVGFILKVAQKNPYMNKKFILDILMERLNEEDELLWQATSEEYSLDGEFQEYSYNKSQNDTKKGK